MAGGSAARRHHSVAVGSNKAAQHGRVDVLDRLGARRPTYEPRASGHIGAIIGIPLAAIVIAVFEAYTQRYEVAPEVDARAD